MKLFAERVNKELTTKSCKLFSEKSSNINVLHVTKYVSGTWFGKKLYFRKHSFCVKYFEKNFNPFHVSGNFLYPLKIISAYVFKEYRKRPLACNGLN